MPANSNPASDPSEAAAQWVARRLNGEHDADDQRDFMHWLNASQANRVAYDRAEALWQELGGLDQVADRQLVEARAYLRHARQPGWKRWALAVAASFAAILIWHFDPLSYLDDQIYRTAHGQRRAIDLADGSRLELNTDSEALVHYSRRGREIQLLRGQALFTVRHRDDHPFDVLAGNVRVHDIGTQFDVRRHADRVSVAVLEGAVEVGREDGGAVSQLQQGQGLSITASGQMMPVEAIDVAASSAWRDGRLVFSARPLKEVLEELGRYHSASLTVSKPEILAVKVSGTFPTDDLALTLKTIAATLPVKLTQTGPQGWQIAGR